MTLPSRGGFETRPYRSAMETSLFTTLSVTGYLEAWKLQKAVALRRAEGSLPDCLILLEHPHTYTLGRRGKLSDVLVKEDALKQMGAQLFHVDRGGEVTYHGPGQMVAYPIVDVRPLGGAAAYVRTLESVLIHALADFGLDAQRRDGLTGVWAGNEKIAAIGVKISRGITTHGFALNVNPDLSYFQHIVPCGVKGMAVTSMEKLLGTTVPPDEVATHLMHHFGLLLRRRMKETTVEEMLGVVLSY